MVRLRVALLSLLLAAALAPSAHAVTFHVTATEDAADADPDDGICATAAGDCTLRAAVQQANTTTEADTVRLPAGTFTLDVPGAGEDAGATGDLDTTARVKFDGAGSDRTTITGSIDEQLLTFHEPSGVVTLEDLAVRDAADGALDSYGVTLTLRRTAFTGNADEFSVVSVDLGSDDANVTIHDTEITDNSSGGDIVGMEGTPTSVALDIQRSTFMRNAVDGGRGVVLLHTWFHPDRLDIEVADTVFADNDLGAKGSAALTMTPEAATTPTVKASVLRTRFERNVAGAGAEYHGGGGMAFITGSGTREPVRSAGRGASEDPTVLTITDSSFIGNVGSHGGGLYSRPEDIGDPRVIITGTTFAGNRAIGSGEGGAILMRSGDLELRDSTLSGNRAASVGGDIAVREPATAALAGVTVAGNHAETGGGGGIAAPDGGVTVVNSILDGNTAEVGPAGCSGYIVSEGHNLDSGTSCAFRAAGDAQQVDGGLGPLSDNGGPTWTHAITRASPAFDAADGARCAALDQRGVARPQFDGCDIGAFEVAQPPPAPAPEAPPGGAPPGPAPPGPVFPPVVDRTAPNLGIRARSRIPRRRLIKRGLRVSVTCSEACRAEATLRRRGRTLGRAAGEAPAGEAARLNVRLTRAGKRLLRRGRRGPLRLRVVVEDAAGNTTGSSLRVRPRRR